MTMRRRTGAACAGGRRRCWPPPGARSSSDPFVGGRRRLGDRWHRAGSALAGRLPAGPGGVGPALRVLGQARGHAGGAAGAAALCPLPGGRARLYRPLHRSAADGDGRVRRAGRAPGGTECRPGRRRGGGGRRPAGAGGDSGAPDRAQVVGRRAPRRAAPALRPLLPLPPRRLGRPARGRAGGGAPAGGGRRRQGGDPRRARRRHHRGRHRGRRAADDRGHPALQRRGRRPDHDAAHGHRVPGGRRLPERGHAHARHLPPQPHPRLRRHARRRHRHPLRQGPAGPDRSARTAPACRCARPSASPALRAGDQHRRPAAGEVPRRAHPDCRRGRRIRRHQRRGDGGGHPGGDRRRDRGRVRPGGEREPHPRALQRRRGGRRARAHRRGQRDVRPGHAGGRGLRFGRRLRDRPLRPRARLRRGIPRGRPAGAHPAERRAPRAPRLPQARRAGEGRKAERRCSLFVVRPKQRRDGHGS